MPRDVPAAATAPDPTYPEPTHNEWPFPNAFSPTSGTGRLDGGAELWTDFLYDDYGASGPGGFNTSPFAQTSTLAPRQGDYSFPSGPADNNGADIFRAGIGIRGAYSYWRVDWVTLASPTVPIAEWTFDTDNNPATGGSAWPADAGVNSPGIDEALVVSSRGAWLINPSTGASTSVTTHGGRLFVNPTAKSFIVKIPLRLMPVRGTWRIRLAAGLASANGQTFAEPDVAGVPSATAERVYNVTFRTVSQEPPVDTSASSDAGASAAQGLLASLPLSSELGLDGLARAITGNFWMEDDQASTLASRNVSKFSLLLPWARLRRRVRTPIPQPTGYSVRWYVSRFADLGHGQVIDDGPEGNLKPTLLEPLQPYSIYVPTGYRPGHAVGLTFLLHSLEVNYNQYGALDPDLIQQLCQDRNSICVTTEGLGPSGWYYGGAETDFWQVWRHVAEAFTLNPNRTVIAGYSMGGWAAYKLALEHPDDFAGALVLDGPVICGINVLPGLGVPAGSGTNPGCAKDSQSAPLLANAKWIPYVIDQTFGDELVPTTGVLAQANTFATLGERYQLFVHTGGDHLIYATEDRFGDAVTALGNPVRAVDPGSFTYDWYPSLDSTRDGIGATGDYWVSGLAARERAYGTIASVIADDQAIPEPATTPVRDGTSLVTEPIPGTHTGLVWRLGARSRARPQLTLALRDVAALTVDMAEARLTRGIVRVTSDGPARLTLADLPAGATVRLISPRTGRVVPRRDRCTVIIGTGTTTIRILPRRR
ncbi:prolyl oligopeptidase family serine peptidase [Conexibacter sp. DBS9H8]|uniref:prolyl oligopeptidase family serine peptidase n=1 Tax=Conexibacter sp. DBS9H8 TaxID=2937801 RepID=UPI00200FD037|nr:prolyl oligopeptidase family serine peptidase [Conexibacter sp. DBS9H8]